MKKIIFSALLAMTTPVASGAEYGIGVSITRISDTPHSSGMGSSVSETVDTLYYPIKTENYIFEPYISFGEFENERKIEGSETGSIHFDTLKSRHKALGMGLFRNWSLSESIAVYAGGRIALAKRHTQEHDPNGIPHDHEEHIFAPALGAQYLPHPKFSLALEYKISYVSTKDVTTFIDGPQSDIHNIDDTYSQTELIARIFF